MDLTLNFDIANNPFIISDDLRIAHVCISNSKGRHVLRDSIIPLMSWAYLGSPLATSSSTLVHPLWKVDMGAKNEWDISVCKEPLNEEGTIVQSTEHGF